MAIPMSQICTVGAVLLATLAAGCGSSSYGSSSSSSSDSAYSSQQPRNLPPSQLLAPRTKTSGCQARGALQDHACTPGAIFQGVTKSKICRYGYTRTVRFVTYSTKTRVYHEYGIYSHRRGQYEVDHLVPLELGGSNTIANLWPEAADPPPGFHEKDQVENYLHDKVCSGRISLHQAEQQIATNWLSVYKQMSP